jgi:hypothetical protein
LTGKAPYKFESGFRSGRLPRSESGIEPGEDTRLPRCDNRHPCFSGEKSGAQLGKEILPARRRLELDGLAEAS